MSHQTDLRFEQTGKASGILFDGNESIAEIRDLRLCNIRFRPGGKRLIGDDVPLPLYWEQYANHQHPERNAGSHAEIRCVSQSPDHLTVECSGASASLEVASTYNIEVSYSVETDSYVFDFRCALSVAPGKSWRVTRNDSHGELEFCNLWPAGAFVIAGSKRYQSCYLEKKSGVYRIPHHHLDTPDKHNIAMGEGNRFLWLLEDENPVVEIRSSDMVTAGLCAYMWDAHFAYRVCGHDEEIRLQEGSNYRAAFRLCSISRREGERIRDAAVTIDVPEMDGIPIYIRGRNAFSETRPPVVSSDIWPWQHASEGVMEFWVDREVGHGDHSSLRIQSHTAASGNWNVTALGPAFGEEPFADGKRYRLSGFVRTRNLRGEARLGLRVHRQNIGDVFDIGSYETYHSTASASGNTDWMPIDVTTPPISPAPDRVHLLLEQIGEGASWFDDVLFERNV